MSVQTVGSDVSDEEYEEAEEDVHCKKCDIDVVDGEKSIFCEGLCRSWYHIDCVGINKKQYGQINVVEKLVTWMCASCKKQMKNLWKEKRDYHKILQKLESLEQQVCNSNTAPIITSYANVVAKNSNQMDKNKGLEFISHEKTLILKPKNVQTKVSSTKILKEKIDPTTVGAPVKFFKATEKGNIVIKSDNAQNLEKLMSHAKKNLEKDFDIEMKSQHYPRLKLTGLLKKYDDGDSLLNDLKLLNRQMINDDDRMKVVYARQAKRSKKWVVHVETNGKTFKKLVNTKLDMGWSYCHIYEDLMVLRCYKCSMFGHKSADCKSNVKVCSYCEGPHSRSECDSQEKRCTNCHYVNRKYNPDHRFDHDSENEQECPTLAKKCRMARERINFK